MATASCEATCVVCNLSSAANEHPYMYGRACDGCMVEAEDVVLRWAKAAAFNGFQVLCETENCSEYQRLQIDKNNNMMRCIKCSYSNGIIGNTVAIREDFKERIVETLWSNKIQVESKRPLRVLSLCDGIGSGSYVLKDNLRLDVEKYFYAEVDGGAEVFACDKYDETAVSVGNVLTLTSHRLRSLGRIDLLLAAPPSAELSKGGKGIHDPSGSGHLILEFLWILRELQTMYANTGHHMFWILKSLSSMPSDTSETISTALGCGPTEVDGGSYLPIEWKRKVWSNIPRTSVSLPESPVTLDEILFPCRSGARRPRLPLKKLPLTSDRVLGGTNNHPQGKRPGRKGGKKAVEEPLPAAGVRLVIRDEVEDDEDTMGAAASEREPQGPPLEGLWAQERERLMGFPPGYTAVAGLSASQRHRLLARAWCAPVLRDLLCTLASFFQRLEERDSSSTAASSQ